MPASSCSTGYEPNAQTTGNSRPSSHQAARAASLFSRPMNPMTSCLGSSNRAQPTAGGRSAAASQDCFAVSRSRSPVPHRRREGAGNSLSQHPGCRPGTGLAGDHVDGYTRASADRAWRDWLSGWRDLCVLRRGAGGDLPGSRHRAAWPRCRAACGVAAGRGAGGTVGVTAPVAASVATRGVVRDPDGLSGVRGRIGAGLRLRRVSPGQRCAARAEGERSEKPSAQPTLVRTQHLPPPAENGPLAAETRPAGRLLLVTPCISVYHCGSMCCGVHGRIDDMHRAGLS